MVGAELTKLLQSLATEYFTLGTSLCAEARNKAAARQTAYERLQEITEMSFTHQHVDNPSYSSLILMHSSPQLSQKTLSTLCQSMWKVPYCRRYFWLSRCYTNTVRASKHTIHREINTARQDFCNRQSRSRNTVGGACSGGRQLTNQSKLAFSRGVLWRDRH